MPTRIRRTDIADDPGSTVRIVPATSTPDYEVALALFDEYGASLEIDLSFQDFVAEREAIQEIYGPPDGGLWLGYVDAQLVGCVALRRLDTATCEMKRLYVCPAARGYGVGRALAVALIAAARAARYRRLVLDTLASMVPAQTLYRSLGFRDTAAYYDNPLPDVVYFELTL
jgi:ribosomal protein S18 acetylase RimI-like enzyme